MTFLIIFFFRDGVIKIRSNFEQMISTNNSDWSTWVINTLVKSPFSWSVGRIESVLSPTIVVDEKSEYVILHLVEVMFFFLYNLT